MEALQLLFDTETNGTYALWKDSTNVSTTRLSFELQFSEEMDEASLADQMSFVGGESRWEMARNGTASYWVNVSRLEALVRWALLATEAWADASPQDLDPLRQAGLDDAAILEAAAVVGHFNHLNRVLDVLGVEPPSP